MMTKIAVLLGAGSSIPAGYPSTEELTNSILCGYGIYRHTDGAYYINPDRAKKLFGVHPRLDHFNKLSRLVVQWLNEEVDRYYSTRSWFSNKQTNYEDIFYLAEQAYANEWEIENPAIRLFIDEITKYISSIETQQKNIEYNTIFNETCHYITDIVWRKLSYKAENVNHLKIIECICRKFNVTCIATLCHDTHIETYLTKQNIFLVDGFCKQEAGVRYWNGNFSSHLGIPFLKIHGSCNWFRLAPQSTYNSRIGIPLNEDHDHTRTINGELQIALDGRPLLLIGTFNKILDYSSSIFLDIFYYLRSKMNEANIMIICGYSFGDKGINGEIITWYHNSPHRRFVIIHPNPDELINNARPAINRLFQQDAKNSITFIRKHLECVDFEKELCANLVFT